MRRWRRWEVSPNYEGLRVQTASGYEQRARDYGNDAMSTLVSSWTTVLPGYRFISDGFFAVDLPKFNAAGRDGDRDAFLIYSLRGLGGVAANGHADVFLNEFEIGTITRAPVDYYITQILIFKGKFLSGLDRKDNRIAIRNITDRFELNGMVCSFHKNT
jgi:hypothetical protein